MHITKYTDYSIRTLMYLAVLPKTELSNIGEISKTFSISRNHLMKVVNDLVNNGLVVSVRGRLGGIKLGQPAEQINIGALIRGLEATDRIVDCDNGPCLFRGQCGFDLAVQKATDAFFAELDRYTLADLVKRKGKLSQLIRMPG
tara:strand:- start:96 stop:527 length:432 start_codon:yes stop_codon:yes gene_type:complete